MWSSRSLLSLLGAEVTTRTLSCGSGVLLGSTLLVNNQGAEEKPKSWTVEYPSKLKNDNSTISRKIVSDVDKSGLDLRLYQYQSCPFCCKVRAFLDYYGFSYEVVEVNPVTRKQLKFSSDYKKVPVLTSSCCHKPLVESSLIISALATFLKQKEATLDDALSLYPPVTENDSNNAKKQTITYPNKFFVIPSEKDSIKSQQQLQNIREEREWREWVDEHFIHLISPNVYRTWNEALETFHQFDKVGEWERNFSAWERYLSIYVGAAAMFQISKRLKKRHNIDDERRVLKDAFEKFLAAKGPDRKFLGGSEPNLADLALYGAINSFAGCTAFREMREKTEIGTWFDDMHTIVQERRGGSLLKEKCDAIKTAKASSFA